MTQHPIVALATFATSVLLLGATLSAAAASSAASSASDSVATSVGSVSGSLKTSSNSSTRGNNVAEGDYRIIDVALADEKPGTVRVQLQAVAEPGADGEVFLYLPQAVAEQTPLAKGGIVSARQRAYGIEFADGATRQAFFLVLRDDWYRELQTKAVVL